jgi:hypothetical protein
LCKTNKQELNGNAVAQGAPSPQAILLTRAHFLHNFTLLTVQQLLLLPTVAPATVCR